jgi:uncharacterized glyoxalase superfamily protein PhnB
LTARPLPPGYHSVNPYIVLDDVDAACRTAVHAAAESILAPTDQPHGGRVGGVHDPFGKRWWIATHVRDFST